MIYFDNAATTMMSSSALQALIEVSQEYYGNPSSIYRHGKRTKSIIDESRLIVANCIGALPEEIYFTSGGTESDNWAVSQAISQNIDTILISNVEHHAIQRPAQLMKMQGKKLKIVPSDKLCIIQLDALKNNLDNERALVSIMLQNNETGTIQDIKELATLVHSINNESLFHTDAVQAVGHISIDVKQMGIDMLSASAHKFNGPKGIGFMYIKNGTNASPFILGGGQEKGMRSGTENAAAIYSMAIALDENVKGIEENRKLIKSLEQQLLLQLNKTGIQYSINADSRNRANGILNLSFKGIDGEGLLNMLDAQNISISVGSACNSKSKERSHVLKAIGLTDDIIDSSVRISIGKYNTKQDISELVRGISRSWKASQIASM